LYEGVKIKRVVLVVLFVILAFLLVGCFEETTPPGTKKGFVAVYYLDYNVYLVEEEPSLKSPHMLKTPYMNERLKITVRQTGEYSKTTTELERFNQPPSEVYVTPKGSFRCEETIQGSTMTSQLKCTPLEEPPQLITETGSYLPILEEQGVITPVDTIYKKVGDFFCSGKTYEVTKLKTYLNGPSSYPQTELPYDEELSEISIEYCESPGGFQVPKGIPVLVSNSLKLVMTEEEARKQLVDAGLNESFSFSRTAHANSTCWLSSFEGNVDIPIEEFELPA
jgi:hypothetical protein